MENGHNILILECGVYRSGSLRIGAGRNNAYRVVVGKLERKRLFGSPKCRWGGGYIKMEFKMENRRV
jgi:hypothetical protein